MAIKVDSASTIPIINANDSSKTMDSKPSVKSPVSSQVGDTSKLGDNAFQSSVIKKSLNERFEDSNHGLSGIRDITNKIGKALFKEAEKFAKLPDTIFHGKTSPKTVVHEAANTVHLTMGNPSNAQTDVKQADNYLLVKEQYSVSYNRDKGTPNWVSWHVDQSDLGSVKRSNDFRPDDTLPKDWYHVTPQDYSGSGYDRGHMTPSGDRTSTKANNSATFLMTNMIPQASNNNQKTWANLENYCRELVNQGNELYVISGGQGSKGTIANGKVNVPENTWKVILIQPKGENDISRVTDKTRVISVYMPNDNKISEDWRKYLTSVDQVEKNTGYDFFSNIPDKVENAIEAKVDKG